MIGYLVDDGLAGEEGKLLIHDSEGSPHIHPVWRVGQHVHPPALMAVADASIIRQPDSLHDLEQRRLSPAAISYDRGDLPFIDVQVEVLHQQDVENLSGADQAAPFKEASHFDDWSGIGAGGQGRHLSYASHELSQDLLRLAFGHDLPLLQPDQPVCQILVNLRQVRDNHNGQVQLPAHIFDGIQHLLLGGRAGHGSRLIQQQHPGLLGQLPGNDQPLLLSAAEDGGQVMGLLLQAHQAQVVHGLLIYLVVIGIFGDGQHLIARDPGVDAPHHVLQCGLRPEGKVPLQVYGGQGHLLPSYLRGAVGRYGDAIHDDPAGVKVLHAPQDLHQCAFAPSALSHQPQYLAGPGGKADIFQGYDLPVFEPVRLG